MKNNTKDGHIQLSSFVKSTVYRAAFRNDYLVVASLVILTTLGLESRELRQLKGDLLYVYLYKNLYSLVGINSRNCFLFP